MKRILTALLVISLSLAAMPTSAIARAKPAPPVQTQTKPTSTEIITIDQQLTAEQFNRFVLPKPPTTNWGEEVFMEETTVNDFKSSIVRGTAKLDIPKTNATTDYEALRLTYDYVIANMQPASVASEVAASESLESGFGGAFEYNNVLVALLKSQLIPAVVVQYYDYDATAVMYDDPSWTTSISDFLDGSLGKMLNKEYSHLACYITVAFVDGVSYYMDPFAGEDAPDTYFDIDFEASLDKCVILPPSTRTPAPHNPTFPAEVSLNPVDDELIIDGHVVEKYKLINAHIVGSADKGGVHDILFFSLQDFATGLAMYSKTPEKTYEVAKHALDESIIVPGLARAPTHSEFNYTNSNSEGVLGTWYLYYGLWDTSPEEWLTVRYSEGRQVYLGLSAMDDICAELDIYVEYHATSTVINTRKPFLRPANIME